MFTGIIEQTGRVLSIEITPKGAKLSLFTDLKELVTGESIAVNGVCLTVVEFQSSGVVDFYLSHETLECSNLGGLKKGGLVNMERALTLSSRLSGHIVQGHVDGLAECAGISQLGDGYRLDMAVDKTIGRYCVNKGSISLSGISLTLVNVRDDDRAGHTLFSVHVIPYTWNHTNLCELKEKDKLNAEVDILAKYLERLWQR